MRKKTPDTKKIPNFALSYTYFYMRKLYQKTALLLFAVGLLGSCSTKVELYSDYKDVPIVYGLINVMQDTNYVKIFRAFSGSNDQPINAHEVALIADSSNYPGKLDARIVEYKNTYGLQYNPTGREIILDTITIHNKLEGDFYAPDQKVYYTTERFNTNNASQNVKYKYKLVIRKEADTVTSETGIVGGSDFRIITSSVTFTPNAHNKTGRIMFKPAENAAVYEVRIEFNYKEKRPNADTVYKKVGWSFGTMMTNELGSEGNLYSVTYKQDALFNALASAIGNDTLYVERFIGDTRVYVSAGGLELYNYIQVNSPSESLSQSIPDYTNINGGFGVFSSRINIDSRVSLSNYTIQQLLNWGFRQR